MSFNESELKHWKLLKSFNDVLLRVSAGSPADLDPRRKLLENHYFSLLLFSFFNPVIDSCRGICHCSEFRKTQVVTGSSKVSLGSFSEAQHVFDSAVLYRVFKDLAGRVDSVARSDRSNRKLTAYADVLMGVDGSLWRAIPRLQWASWRFQHKEQKAVKLHLKFNILKDFPVDATVTEGKRCERSQWLKLLKPGEFYCADRNFSQNYRLLEAISQKGCQYVTRIRDNAVLHTLKELPLSEQDRAAGIESDQWIELGGRGKITVRRVCLRSSQGKLIQLITNCPEQELSPELIALIYKKRWQIELFFRWLKHLLQCQKFLAYSKDGVTHQLYCALIATLLLTLYLGKKPSKRMIETMRLHMLGYVHEDELELIIKKQAQKT